MPRIAAHSHTDRLLCTAPGRLNLHRMLGDIPKMDFAETGPLKMGGRKLNRELGDKLTRFKPDVVFIPVERHFTFGNVPVVHMLQNMEPLVSPFRGNPPGEKIKNLLRRLSTRRALNGSDRVIAISAFVRDFITLGWNIPREKVGLVYHGIDDTRLDGADMTAVGFPVARPEKLIFTAGSIRPARGLEDLLSALNYLRSNNIRIPVLVIAGSVDPEMSGYRNRLKKQADRMGLSETVLWAGQLNEAQMRWYYRNCDAFVMTSRVESFGHTAGEALSCGSPCVSADNPCLPEIFGDAAHYYPSGDGGALAAVLEKVLSMDDHQRVFMKQAARRRAALFSWDVCAERTVEELKRAARGG